MSKDTQQQISRGVLAGDAMTWAAGRQRLNLLPPKRRRRIRFLDEFFEQKNQTTLAVPYLHSTHESAMNPIGPADIGEWYAVSALSAMGLGLEDSKPGRTGIWKQLATARASDPESIRGRLGTTIALETVHRTASFETSGKDNPHYFDDLSIIRAIAYAVFGEGCSIEDVEAELRVTVSEDGLEVGLASFELTRELINGSAPEKAVAKAISMLRAGGWALDVVAEAMQLAEQAQSIDQLGVLLESKINDHVYSYPIAAPETLAMVCAYLTFSENREQLLLAGFLNSSRSETLVPILWGYAGAIYAGFESTSQPLQGSSIGAFAGLDLEALSFVGN